MRGLILCIFCLIVMALACSRTNLVVRKVRPGDRTTPGVRYSLPRPFLRVTPGADGTIAVEVEYLPDSDNTYAIDAESVLASHRLDIQVERGLLRKIDWTGGSAGVSEELARDTARVVRTGLEERAREREERRKKGEKEEDELRRSREEAEKDVTRARRELRAARAELEVLSDARAEAVEVLRARVRVEVAEANLLSAELELERREAAAAGDSSMNLPVRGQYPTVRGPMFYAIVETTVDGNPSVTLEAVEWPGGEAQSNFETTFVPTPRLLKKPPELAPEGGVHPVLPDRTALSKARKILDRAEARLQELKTGRATSLSIAKAMADVAEAKIDMLKAKALRFKITSTRPLVRLLFDEGRSAIERLSPPEPRFTPPPDADLGRWIHIASPSEIQVTLPDSFPPGEYSLLLGFQYHDGQELCEHAGSVDFTIERLPE